MSKFQIKILPSLSDNYIFIISCLETNKTACIDPGDADVVIEHLQKNSLTLDYILITHHHYDHINGVDQLKKKYKAITYGPKLELDKIPQIDYAVTEQENIKIGLLNFEILLLNGHTNGHIAYYAKNENILFSGDVIFSSGSGYLFEGTYDEMYNSLEKIKKLPKQTKIYFSHEYTLENIEFALSIEQNNLALQKKKLQIIELLNNKLPSVPTTLEIELKTNPFLRTLSPEIRKNIGKNSDSYNNQIYKKIRELKNSFNK